MGQRLKKRKTETRDPDSTVLDISKYIDKIPESQKVKLRETDDSVSFILIDLRLPGNQVTYVSAGFESLTGYSRDEIIGKKLKLIGTNPRRKIKDVDMMWECIRKRCEGQFTISKIKKSGESVTLVPLCMDDTTDEPSHFLGLQMDLQGMLNKMSKL